MVCVFESFLFVKLVPQATIIQRFFKKKFKVQKTIAEDCNNRHKPKTINSKPWQPGTHYKLIGVCGEE